MEFGVRDWMIIVGVLLILAVLLDGYRRVRNERRDNIRMSLNKQFLNGGASVEDNSSELPNGGARRIDRDDEDSDDILGLKKVPTKKLDFEQSVPILMEQIAEAEAAEDSTLVAEEYGQLESFTANGGVVSSPSATREPECVENVASDSVDDKIECSSEPEDISDEDALRPHTAKAGPSQRADTSVQSEEVMVINVIAKDKPFKGPDLLHILLACDLRFGDMSIFHRHEQNGGHGAVQFSMANSVEPGRFNLDTIDDFTTPGVCFFMSVPGPEKPIKAFEYMVETAQCLATNLDGELLDESRSAMTNQTLEHCRQRLHDFERRQLTHL